METGVESRSFSGLMHQFSGTYGAAEEAVEKIILHAAL